MKKKSKTFGKARWLRSKIKKGDLVLLSMRNARDSNATIKVVKVISIKGDMFSVNTELGYAQFPGKCITPITNKYKEENPEMFI